MDYIQGTTKSLALTHLCNLGIAAQLYNRKEQLEFETIIASVIAGLYLADLNSGLVHILFDTYEGENSVLKTTANYFAGHHLNPKLITKAPSLQLFTETSITPYNLSCLLYNTTPFTSKKQMIAQLSFLLASNLVQLTHQLAHFVNHASKKEKKHLKYRIVKMLQDNHIILKTEQHRKHHQTYDTNFCILNGWANPLLNFVYSTAKQTSNKI